MASQLHANGSNGKAKREKERERDKESKRDRNNSKLDSCFFAFFKQTSRGTVSVSVHVYVYKWHIVVQLKRSALRREHSLITLLK